MSVAQSQLAARAYLVGMLAPTRRGHGSWRPGTVSPPTTTTTTCAAAVWDRTRRRLG